MIARMIRIGLVEIVCLAWMLGSVRAGPGDSKEFVVSPPVRTPAARESRLVQTDLRELIDARGLALLVQDDKAARHLSRLVSTWEKKYAGLLGSDPELARIDRRTRQLFGDNLACQAGRHAPAGQLSRQVAAIPKEQMYRTLTLWLKGLFLRQGVFFARDMDRLSADDLAGVCRRARALDSRKGLPSWRYRVLLWRWRDSQVKRLFAERDERLAFLTPVRIDGKVLGAGARRALERYLAMLRNLRLEVLRNREHPYERYRTLDGLLRGLRYMDTIREAARATGLDHLVMTGLYIQESEFIHHRVSVAGAFSIAQFLNIAIKDVWLFRRRIPGSKILLSGIGSWEELKKKMIVDPRMAIKVSCLYFRRLRDDVARQLRSGAKGADSRMVDLLSLEMFTMRRGLMERSQVDTTDGMAVSWPARAVLPLPVVPIGGAAVPEPTALLQRLVERMVREMAEVRITEQVFSRRLKRLQTALGLASYNAGSGNMQKTARRRHPFQALSFPLQITETRGYVDSIMDSWDILAEVDRIASDVERMDYEDLMRLAGRACRMSAKAK